MRTRGAVRVIKGQEVLSDGSTLEEHGIIDGSTVNIVIAPDIETNLTIKHGPKEVTCSVSWSVRVRDLKQQLIDGGIVSFMLNEFELIISSNDNDGTTDNVPMQDESLPLYLYGVSDKNTIRVISGKVLVHLVIPRGEHFYKSFPKAMTLNEMKQTIRSVDYFFRVWPEDDPRNDPRFQMDILLFVQQGTSYRKLKGETPIGAILSDNDVVYLMEDKFFEQYTSKISSGMIPVYYNGKEIDRVVCSGETVLCTKLRIQEELGFPFSCLDVKNGKNSFANDYRIKTYGSVSVHVSQDSLSGPHQKVPRFRKSKTLGNQVN